MDEKRENKQTGLRSLLSRRSQESSPADHSIVFLGDPEYLEYASATDFLSSQSNIQYCINLSSLKIYLQENNSQPKIIVIGQRFPNEFDVTELEKIKLQLPHTKFVALLGSWCEGELRSGQPYETICRFHWFEFVCDHQMNSIPLESIKGKFDIIPSLPVTHSLEEWFLSIWETSASSLSGCHVTIVSNSYDTSQWLERLLEDASAEVSQSKTLLGSSTQTDLVLWDVEQISPAEKADLKKFNLQNTEIPLIGLFSFLRWQDQEPLLNQGFSSLISKPLSCPQLIETIYRLITKE